MQSPLWYLHHLLQFALTRPSWSLLTLIYPLQPTLWNCAVLWGSITLIKDKKTIEVGDLDVCDLWGVKVDYGTWPGSRTSGSSEGGVLSGISSKSDKKGSKGQAKGTNSTDIPFCLPSKTFQRRYKDVPFTTSSSYNRTMLWYGEPHASQVHGLQTFPRDCIGNFGAIYKNTHVGCMPTYTPSMLKYVLRGFRRRMSQPPYCKWIGGNTCVVPD